MTDKEEASKNLSYRDMLQKLEQESQNSYDKAVLTLSGGALGISFAFIKDVVGTKPITNQAYLLTAWILWGISILSILFSFYFSNLALRKAVDQLDKGDQPSNWYDTITAVLNVAGGVLFLLGVIFIVVFVSFNVR